jgi:hypothetical integral membrane protein (TIGR02206 family)
MQYFSLLNGQHLLTIFIIGSVMITIPALVRRVNSTSLEKIVAMTIAGILLPSKIGEPLFKLYTGQEWQTQLPLQLCDVGAIAIALFLLHEKTLLFELGYFWGLGGGLQAVLTPDLQFGFPDINFIFFFFTHGLCLVGVMYAIIVFKYRPTIKSIGRVFFITLLYALIIIPVNLLLDTNYLYLSHKPIGASLLDFLGPWPWYILSLVLVSLVFFFLYYSPFFVADLIKRIKN